jgi:predicted methyltransferase
MMAAAIAALPHERPKLAVTANLNGEEFGDALERAIRRSGKVINSTPIQAQ